MEKKIEPLPIKGEQWNLDSVDVKWEEDRKARFYQRVK